MSRNRCDTECDCGFWKFIDVRELPIDDPDLMTEDVYFHAIGWDDCSYKGNGGYGWGGYRDQPDYYAWRSPTGGWTNRTECPGAGLRPRGHALSADASGRSQPLAQAKLFDFDVPMTIMQLGLDTTISFVNTSDKPTRVRSCGVHAYKPTNEVEALALVDGVPYYAHGGEDLNDVIHRLRGVLDDHGVPEFRMVLVFGRAGFGTS